MLWVGVAYPQLVSRRSRGIWLNSTGTGFIRASLSLATASRSEACGCGRARLRPLELAARAVTALVRGWLTGGETLQKGRFCSLGASASKLGMGRQLLGPGKSFILALVLPVGRGRVRHANPALA